MRDIRPFPAPDQLPRLSPSQVMLLDRVSRWLELRPTWSCAALEPVLGFPLSMAAQEIGPGSRARRLDSSQLIVCEHAGSGETALVEVDGTVALELVWLTLTGKVEATTAAPRELDRVEQGVLLYLASRVVCALWETGEPPFRVAGLGREAELQSMGDSSAVIHLVLRAGTTWGHAWLHLPHTLGHSLPGLRSDELTGPPPPIPTALHVVLGRSSLTAAQLAGVRVGDVVVIDEQWSRPTADDRLGLSQPDALRLRLPLGRQRWKATLTPQGELTVTAEVDAGANHQGAAMEQGDDRVPKNSDELLAEIPAELSIELGRIALNAAEAMSLRAGQTLRLDRRAGDAVDIRIGPKLIARGELVQVEEELGVLLREVFEPG